MEFSSTVVVLLQEGREGDCHWGSGNDSSLSGELSSFQGRKLEGRVALEDVLQSNLQDGGHSGRKEFHEIFLLLVPFCAAVAPPFPLLFFSQLHHDIVSPFRIFPGLERPERFRETQLPHDVAGLTHEVAKGRAAGVDDVHAGITGCTQGEKAANHAPDPREKLIS